jgi:hypothetical protein
MKPCAGPGIEAAVIRGFGRQGPSGSPEVSTPSQFA